MTFALMSNTKMTTTLGLLVNPNEIGIYAYVFSVGLSKYPV